MIMVSGASEGFPSTGRQGDAPGDRERMQHLQDRSCRIQGSPEKEQNEPS